MPNLNTLTGIVTYVATGPVLMAVFFTVAASLGYVTSDPAGLHPITVAQMWGIR